MPDESRILQDFAELIREEVKTSGAVVITAELATQLADRLDQMTGHYTGPPGPVTEEPAGADPPDTQL
jgi:hypothetical protein